MVNRISDNVICSKNLGNRTSVCNTPSHSVSIWYCMWQKKKITTIDYIIAKNPNQILTLHVIIAFFVSFDTVVGFSKLLSTTFISLFQYMFFLSAGNEFVIYFDFGFLFSIKSKYNFHGCFVVVCATSITSYNAPFLLSFWWPIVW